MELENPADAMMERESEGARDAGDADARGACSAGMALCFAGSVSET